MNIADKIFKYMIDSPECNGFSVDCFTIKKKDETWFLSMKVDCYDLHGEIKSIALVDLDDISKTIEELKSQHEVVVNALRRHYKKLNFKMMMDI